MAELALVGLISAGAFVGTCVANYVSSWFTKESSQRIENLNGQIKNEVNLVKTDIYKVGIVEVIVLILLVLIIAVPSVYFCVVKCKKNQRVNSSNDIPMNRLEATNMSIRDP